MIYFRRSNAVYSLQTLYKFHRDRPRYKAHYMNCHGPRIRSDYQRQKQAHYCEEDQFLYHIYYTSNSID